MREIKFRGWSIFENKWVYGYLTVKFNHRSDEKHYFIYSESGMSGWRVDPESVGQYIGLNDRRGKEVYEGDIVNHVKKNHWENVAISYFEGAFVVGYRGHAYSSTAFNFPKFIKVIGNTYENKELLNDN